MRQELKIKADKDCKACKGWGLLPGDSVPYGSTWARLPDEYCHCVMDQVPDYDIVVEIDDEVMARERDQLEEADEPPTCRICDRVTFNESKLCSTCEGR